MTITGMTITGNYEKRRSVAGRGHLEKSWESPKGQELKQTYFGAEKNLNSSQLQERMEQELQKSQIRRQSLMEWEKESAKGSDKNVQEQNTQTNIVVKPDGSRVLVMTVNIGGMETTMSMEISKPTELPNNICSQETEEDLQASAAQEEITDLSLEE